MEAHLEAAKAQLRGFARHIAIEADEADLFKQFEAVSRDFAGEAHWSTLWWEVPFSAVIDGLRERYAEIPRLEPHLEVLEGVETVDDLRERFHGREVEITPDPYELAALNMKRLEGMLAGVHDLHVAWIELCTEGRPHPSLPAANAADAVMYLKPWSDAELLNKALEILEDDEFRAACGGCLTLEAIRHQLDLASEVVDAHREERCLREQEAERDRRTIDIAGVPFEVGGAESYPALFERLAKLPVPTGPHASRDELTPLTKARQSGGSSNTRSGEGELAQPSPPHPLADFREQVGIVGEIRAYHYLRKEFGEDTVSRDSWVSEIRRKVQPLMEGEPDRISDGHGFDFQFTDKRRRKWYVEVKAAAGEDSQFELGISEIRAANHFARKKRGGRWRVLRVRNALSDSPEFDWLPNPFEDRFKDRYRLHRGGMRVSYARK